eukprot:Skav236294  [mRNA]  locus=scaffold1106:30536:31189:+ [translate_table: standard]
MANSTNQVPLLSRHLPKEERQRLRDLHSPYRMSSMTWGEWSEVMFSYIFGQDLSLTLLRALRASLQGPLCCLLQHVKP